MQAGCRRPEAEGGWRGVPEERLGCRLLGQDQFSLAGDAQPIFLPGVIDQDFLAAVEQIAAGQSFPGRPAAEIGSIESRIAEGRVHDGRSIARRRRAVLAVPPSFRRCAQACRHKVRTRHLETWSRQRKSATLTAPQTRSW